MTIRTIAAAALAAVAITATAHAAVRTFDITASDYELLFGSSNDVPVDPVHLDFTLGFDTSHDATQATAGLRVNAFTLPYATTYAYSVASDILTIATFASPNGCSNPGNSYCGFIQNFSTAPNLFFYQQSVADGGYFLAHSTTMIVTDGGTVPEPATWGLMLAGLGMVGLGLRRRSAKVMVA